MRVGSACVLLLAWACAPAPPAPPARAASRGAPPAPPSPPAPPAAKSAVAAEPNEPSAGGGRALFRRYPALAARLPLTRLGPLPAPLEHADALAKAIGVSTLYLKRDDRIGASYGGGSKLRKLELLLADAEAQGKKRVLAQGGMGSNQTLATALHASRRGLGTILFLLPERPSARTRENVLMQHVLGAEQHLAGAEAIERYVEKLPLAERPYVIETGGSSALGNVGFVNAGLELAEQVARGELPSPDVVYLPLGTGGSAVGLVLGLGAAGLSTRVVAVRSASQRYGTPAELRRMQRETTALLQRLDPSFPSIELFAERLEVREGFVGKGYAEPTASGKKARTLARDHAALELDLTYSAKALAALIADAPKLENRVVVFWLTYDARRPEIDLEAVRVDALPRSLRGYARDR